MTRILQSLLATTLVLFAFNSALADSYSEARQVFMKARR